MAFSLLVRDGEKSYELFSLDDRRDGSWDYFLQNQNGEGTSVSTKNLFDLFDSFFKENF